MKRCVGVLVCIGMVVVVLCMNFLGSASAGSVEEPIIIKYASGGTNPQSASALGMFMFKEMLEERFPERVKVEIFTGTLGGEREIQESTRLGHLNMCRSGRWGLIDPKIDVVSLPFLFRDFEHVNKVLWGPIGQELFQLGEKVGLISVGKGGTHSGWRHITSKKPIFYPKDMKGLKIRTPEIKVIMDVMIALGAKPTPIPFGEVYTALQQGVADAQENPLVNIYRMKFHEVQTHLALIGYVYNPTLVWANLEWWNSLPPEIQQGITEAETTAQIWIDNYIETSETENLYKLLGEGMMINRVKNRDEWEKLAKSAYEPWLNRVGRVEGERLIERLKAVK